MFTHYAVKLDSLVPLLTHNGQMADPENEHAIALKVQTKKKGGLRNPELIRKIEWMAGLYLGKDLRPIIPGPNIEAAMRDVAFKLGYDKTEVIIGFTVQDEVPIIYDGPKDVEKLFAHGGFIDSRVVAVQRARIVRTRPIFKEWSLSFTLQVSDTFKGPAAKKADGKSGGKAESEPDVYASKPVGLVLLEEAGRLNGIGDFTPRYGRFKVAQFDKIKAS